MYEAMVIKTVCSAVEVQVCRSMEQNSQKQMYIYKDN